MAVYFLAEILRIGDPRQYGAYIDSVRAVVQRHGGEYVFRTDRITLVSGQEKPARILLVRFPDRRSLEDCFGSEEYRALAPLRERSAESRAFIIEGDAENC